MAHIHFNHLNAAAFNNFVPEATKTANNELIKNLLVLGGVVFVMWCLLKPKTVSVVRLKEDTE